MSDNALLIDHVDAWHDGRGKQIIHIPILLRRAREGQMMLLPILLHHFMPIFSTDAQGMDIRLVLGLLIEVLYLGKLLLAVGSGGLFFSKRSGRCAAACCLGSCLLRLAGEQ